ncbi:MAG: OmpA family protein [Oligoflexia bacterium]|nr:OmpA family protein [Oligoflexia bacterium]
MATKVRAPSTRAPSARAPSAPDHGPQSHGGKQARLGNQAVLARLGAAGMDSAGGSAGAPDAAGAFAQATQGAGGALPFMDQAQAASGQDLSGVQAFTGKGQVAAAGAKALTDGAAVAFADTNPDQDTVMHELGHVRDHLAAGTAGRGGRSGARASRPGDSSERRADSGVQAAAAGQSLPAVGDPGADIHGNWLDDAKSAVGSAADWVGDQVGDALDIRPDEARLDAEEDLADFLSEDYSVDNYTTSYNLGNFDATYSPRSGSMTVSLRVFFDFKDGSPTDPGWLADRSGPGAADADFQWTAEEKTQYAANFIRSVTSVWSHQFTFFCTRAYWDTLPGVNVDVNVTQAGDAAGSHFHLEVGKWPENRSGGDHMDRMRASHGPEHAGHAGTEDTTHGGGLLLESAEGGAGALDVSNFRRNTNTRSAYGAAATANPGTVTFAQGESEVDAAQTTTLHDFAQVMAAPEMPDFPVSVIGHASSEGAEVGNRRLSEDRARSVNNIIVAGGVKSQPRVRGVGEDGATNDPIWRRVDVFLLDFEAQQRTAVHEFGHMLGLGDEYPGADTTDAAGNVVSHVGEKAEHSELAEEFNLVDDPVVRTHSDNVMSNGEVVRPQHYATFLDALCRMSGIRDEWDTRPAAPAGPGDFVVPGSGPNSGPNSGSNTGLA